MTNIWEGAYFWAISILQNFVSKFYKDRRFLLLIQRIFSHYYCRNESQWPSVRLTASPYSDEKSLALYFVKCSVLAPARCGHSSL